MPSLLDMNPGTRASFRARTHSFTNMPWYSFADTPEKVSEAFISGAIRFIGAAMKLNQALADQVPEQTITFHALELGLKVFLIKKGFKPKRLARKPYGHDLEQLYSEAKAAGLVLRFELVEYMLEWINEWHNGPARVRYEFAEEKTLPMCEVVFPLIEEIISRTRDTASVEGWLL
jgi:hypothetical protein